MSLPDVGSDFAKNVLDEFRIADGDRSYLRCAPELLLKYGRTTSY
jgi:hypothetical protein